MCKLLAVGRMALLLRKGGVHEWDGPGRFEVEYERFALLPAYEHQKLAWLKPGWRPPVGNVGPEAARGDGPSRVTTAASVQRVWKVPSRAAFDQLEDLHPWAKPQVDMRFDYKPDRPLWLLALRASRLAEPQAVPMDERYAGCRSWVPLKPEHHVDDAGAVPAMDDAAFERVLRRVDAAMANKV